MKLSPAIVRIQNITTSQTRDQFSEAKLEEGAQLILKMEEVITPPILLRTGLESYTLIEGDFEYYAACRAAEIDTRKGKKIDAYIVESEDELAHYHQQIKLFRHREAVSSPKPPKSESAVLKSEVVTPEEGDVDRLAHLETIVHQLITKNEALEQTVSQLVARKDQTPSEMLTLMKPFIADQMSALGEQIQRAVETQIKVLGEQLSPLREAVQVEQPSISPPLPPSATPPLTFEEEPAPSLVSQPIPSPSPLIIGTSEEQNVLNEINILPISELTAKLGKVRQKEKLIEFIVREREIRPFDSTKNMVNRAKGTGLLGKKTIDKIVGQWA